MPDPFTEGTRVELAERLEAKANMLEGPRGGYSYDPRTVALLREAASRIDHLEKALQRIEKHVLEPQAARIARAALKGEDDE